MSKKMYSTELKLEIVEKYLTGKKGAKSLAQEYHIGSKADILKWTAADIIAPSAPQVSIL